jgi:hypothetical protein
VARTFLAPEASTAEIHLLFSGYDCRRCRRTCSGSTVIARWISSTTTAEGSNRHSSGRSPPLAEGHAVHGLQQRRGIMQDPPRSNLGRLPALGLR